MNWPEKWKDKAWSDGMTSTGFITEQQVRAVYDALPDMSAVCRTFVACHGASDRRVDKSLQLLRKAGLIQYNKRNGWVKVGEVQP